MKRRALVPALAAAWPRAALAQPAGKVLRLGVLVPSARYPLLEALEQELAELGYRRGRNLAIELRSADDTAQRFDILAAELVQLPLDAIVAVLTPSAMALQRASVQANTQVPIVMAGIGADPVAAGLVQSLAKPGGIVTGVAGLGAVLAGKAFEMMRDFRPSMRRAGALVNASDPFTSALLETIEQAARTLPVELQVAAVHSADAYAAAFAGWSAARVDAGFVQPSLVLARVIDLAMSHRLPSFSFVGSFARAGGLLAYSNNGRDIARRTASFIDRIAKGAKPALMPVEQPKVFDVLINRRTATALGLTVPPSLLVRATEVIE